jgi:glycerol-3-phosphate cytidylyltransferase
MRIGFTASAFDLLHAGHIAMLQEARANCDYLIVGLQVDPSLERLEKNRPVQGLTERYIQLSGCKYVDEIIPYQFETELKDILLTYPINVRFLGCEYQSVDFTGKMICEQRGIELYYNSRLHNYSSSDLRKRILNAEDTRD